MGYRANERGKLSDDFVAEGDGSWPLAQPLFYQYKRTVEPAGRLQGNGSTQSKAMRWRPESCTVRPPDSALNDQLAAQPREETCGFTPAPSMRANARPPQPREGNPARHPHTGPGAEDGRRRPEPFGVCRALRHGRLHGRARWIRTTRADRRRAWTWGLLLEP